MGQLRRKDGAVSIMMVVVLLIGCVIIAGFVDILKRSYTMNEIGYIMDVASVTALRSGVDEQKLRAEEFEVDKSAVTRNYKSLVDEAVTGYGHINSHKFSRTVVEEFEENWGLGASGKARKQVLIDSTVILKVHSNVLFDTAPTLGKKFYNARSNDDFQVTYNGVSENGEIELSIRSVSRVVYR